MSVRQFPPRCALAARCPESVLDLSRLSQSCCQGTEYSQEFGDWGGVQEGERAKPFCFNATGEAMDGIQADCPVITSGPGWRGCACLDQFGYVVADQVCTV